MYMKNCLGDDVLDVITCAKFQNEILGVMILFLQGDEFAIFLFIFEWALQQSSISHWFNIMGPQKLVFWGL